jgi:hypothetical protein
MDTSPLYIILLVGLILAFFTVPVLLAGYF